MVSAEHSGLLWVLPARGCFHASETVLAVRRAVQQYSEYSTATGAERAVGSVVGTRTQLAG